MNGGLVDSAKRTSSPRMQAKGTSSEEFEGSNAMRLAKATHRAAPGTYPASRTKLCAPAHAEENLDGGRQSRAKQETEVGAQVAETNLSFLPLHSTTQLASSIATAVESDLEAEESSHVRDKEGPEMSVAMPFSPQQVADVGRFAAGDPSDSGSDAKHHRKLLNKENDSNISSHTPSDSCWNHVKELTSMPPRAVNETSFPLVKAMNSLSLAHNEDTRFAETASDASDDLLFLPTPPARDMPTFRNRSSVESKPFKDPPLCKETSNLSDADDRDRQQLFEHRRVQDQKHQESGDRNRVEKRVSQPMGTFRQLPPHPQPDTSRQRGAEAVGHHYQRITLKGKSEESNGMVDFQPPGSYWATGPRYAQGLPPELPSQSCGALPDAETIDPVLVVDTFTTVSPIDVTQLHQPGVLGHVPGEPVAEGIISHPVKACRFRQVHRELSLLGGCCQMVASSPSETRQSTGKKNIMPVLRHH